MGLIRPWDSVSLHDQDNRISYSAKARKSHARRTLGTLYHAHKPYKDTKTTEGEFLTSMLT